MKDPQPEKDNPDLLICDEDPASRSRLELTVSELGYKPVAVEDAKQAWAMLSNPGAPRLTIVNWMKSRTDELELCHKLKKIPGRPYTYVILLAHPSLQEHVGHALDVDADELLTQPVDPEQLKSRLAAGRQRIRSTPAVKSETELIIPGYALGRPMHQGIVGVTYQAIRLATRQEVAIKIIQQEDVNPRALARFAREVEILCRLDHPNIVRIIDAGLDIGLYYFAMEYVHGPDLFTYAAKKKLDRYKLLKIMAQVCDGVAYAHEHGVIHRNLKFSNILVGPDEIPKIRNFGLGKSLVESSADRAISMTGEIVGTPAFMAPEQASFQADRIGPPTDVYALGVMLYWLLLGHHPHRLTPPVLEALRRIAKEPIRPPREFAPKLHAQLEVILLNALAKDPAERYPNGRALAEAIRDLLASRVLEKLKAESWTPFVDSMVQ